MFRRGLDLTWRKEIMIIFFFGWTVTLRGKFYTCSICFIPLHSQNTEGSAVMRMWSREGEWEVYVLNCYPNESDFIWKYLTFESFPVNIYTMWQTDAVWSSKCINLYLSVVLASLQRVFSKSGIPFHGCMRSVVSLQTSSLTRIHNHRQFSETWGRCWCQKEGKRGIRSGEGEKEVCGQG